MPENTGPSDPDLLDGWKAVADYLGKSVRTAQRWKNELGLPVHKPSGREGENVFAFRSELDAWRRRAAERDASGATGSRIDPELDTRNGGPAQGEAGRRRWPVVATVALSLFSLLAISAIVAWTRGAPGQPAKYRVADDTLFVFDQDGRELWNYPFPERLREQAYRESDDDARVVEGDDATFQRLPRVQPLVRLADINGDSRNEVLFVERREGLPNSGALFCFSADGEKLWDYLPPLNAQYGDEQFSGKLVYGVMAHVFPESDGSVSIWATFDNQIWFPSVLVKLDAAGNDLGQYWSNGRIRSVSFAEVGDRKYVLVGAPHNETGGGSLAVLDRIRFGGLSPAVKPAYRCLNCPGSLPEHFLVFPATDIVTAKGGHAEVIRADRDVNGTLIVGVLHGELILPGVHREGATLYTLDQSMKVRSAEFFSAYPVVHNEWHRIGLLGRPFDANRDAAQLWPVLRWDGSGFREIPGPER
ncbi:MAG: hypothetical protein Q7V01_09190 [Vicinamibacterales bacterium]|nr:hypothetical protein [Vicinamibacterales bacterium]